MTIRNEARVAGAEVLRSPGMPRRGFGVPQPPATHKVDHYALLPSNIWFFPLRHTPRGKQWKELCWHGPLCDPVDQVTTLWSKKTHLQGGLGGKRNRFIWMSKGLVLLQLDPLDHPFDPEDQVPTLWISAN